MGCTVPSRCFGEVGGLHEGSLPPGFPLFDGHLADRVGMVEMFKESSERGDSMKPTDTQ